MNKHEETAIETASQSYNTLKLYNTTGSLSQYIAYNLFRILRLMGMKYHLIIYEIQVGLSLLIRSGGTFQ
jgi:hypothetical protein